MRLFVFAFTIALAVCARADEPAARPLPPAKLVQQLGHDDYTVRDAATKQLLAAGLEAAEAVRAGLKHADPEIRQRCELILRTLQVAEEEVRRQAILARLTQEVADIRAGKTGDKASLAAEWQRFASLA